MSGFLVPTVTAPLTANGDTGGIGMVTVANASLFTLGATCSLSGTTAPAASYRIVSLNTTTNVLGVRLVAVRSSQGLSQTNYGFSSAAAYTTADGAKITQDAQFIYSVPTS